VPSLGEHPLPALVEAGVVVTINSDDPPMFATTLNNEYVVAASLLGLDVTGVVDLARTAAQVSFLPEAEKAGLIAEIDAYGASWPTG
jgi:aminodeoxyfutalosine deaminase